MHASIANSIINSPAKLFKRFTPSESVKVNATILEYESNYYKHYFSFRYVEATEKTEGEFQPLQGLITPNGFITIKYNGKWRTSPQATNEPLQGDLVVLNEELWIVESTQKIRNKSLVNFATIYLSLMKSL